MIREITEHKTNGMNESLTITATDAPGPGGANHHYEISGLPFNSVCHIVFQNGGISEVGVNGISNESLLAIVADRLDKFQEGKFNCQENGKALSYIRLALEQLKFRTRKRTERGVEGRLVP